MDISAEYRNGRRNFRRANLIDVDLRGANLRGADLSWADLRGADLSGADLSGSNLSGADFRGGNLNWANLGRANLEGTCLDPAATHTPPTDGELDAAGLEYEGDTVYGWRSRTSRHCGNTEYSVGLEYTAHAFSVDATTECHPGLYMAGREWLAANDYPCDIRVSCRRVDLIKAMGKFRCRSLRVVSLATQP